MMNRPNICSVPLRAGWVAYPPFSRGALSRGFSLIEVLIAVVVLAIGLLGLGMVFPVVVRQQRVAQDSVLGYSAAESAAVEVLQRGAGRDCTIVLNFNKTTFPATVDFTWKNPLPAWPAPDNKRNGTVAVALDSIDSAAGLIQSALERDFGDLDAKGRPRTVFGVGNVSVARASNDPGNRSLLVTFMADLSQRDITMDAKVGGVDVGAYLFTLPAKGGRLQRHSITGVTGAMWDRALELGSEVQKGERVLKTSWFDPKTANGISINTTNGTMVVSNSAETGIGEVQLGVADRLSPAPFTGTPQFVSDFWARRSGESQMQVAVFTRRIDTGIRVPSGNDPKAKWTLSNVLTGTPSKFLTTNSGALRVPVAVDSTGRPTLSGADEKGKPNYATFQLAELKRTRSAVGQPLPTYLDFPDGLATSDPAAFQALRQPGQKLVDAFGGVNTVVRADDTQPTGRVRVLLESPISRELFAAIEQLPGTGGGTPQYVLYTAQVPAGVRVVTIERP